MFSVVYFNNTNIQLIFDLIVKRMLKFLIFSFNHQFSKNSVVLFVSIQQYKYTNFFQYNC